MPLPFPPKLSVVVPCFNEEANVPRYAIELFTPILKTVPEAEFIFVDDGSTDTTVVRLEELCKTRKDSRLVRHERNRGLGMAVKTGLTHATGKAVVFLDADLTFHPGEFHKLWAAYADDVDCVIGSPMLGQMEHVPAVRKLLSHGVNLMYRVLLGQRITATSSIFRLYRMSRMKHLNLASESFDINAEIIYRLVQGKAQIMEVPVTLLTRTGGVSKISTFREIKNHLRLLTRIFWWRLGFSS